MARFDVTNTPLAAGATWTSSIFEPRGADRITGSVFADQAGSIFIEQAGGVNYDNVAGAFWDDVAEYSIAAGDKKSFSEEIRHPFVRVRYLNGATPQGAFRIRAQVQSAGGR